MQNSLDPILSEARRSADSTQSIDLSVKSYAQQIYSLDASKDAARLALLNFLVNFYEPQTKIDAKIFENFYQQALGFSFWQENWAHLVSQVKYCVTQIAKKTQISQIPMDWLNGEYLQPVRIQNAQNLTALIYKYLEKTLNPAAQFKILKADEDCWIAIILNEDKMLSVKIFGDTFILSNSELIPAARDFQLTYDANLLLSETSYQHLPIGPHTSARFRMTERGVVGRVLRGYTFQKYEDLSGGPLAQYASVFYPFKKLEQLYINPKTDPFYNEVIHALEVSTEQLQRGDLNLSRSSRIVAQTETTLQKAKQALVAIFPNDKMLSLLISNLEKTLALKNLNESSHMMDV